MAAIVALPSFLFATSRIISGYVGGLPGVHAMWAGADWTWHQPVRRNDAITTEAWLKDLVEHQTALRRPRRSSRSTTCDFFNQHGELVAEADSWCFRTDRDQAREHGTKYTEVKARAAAAATPRRSWRVSTALRRRGGARRDAALLGGRAGRRRAADHGRRGR